MRKKMQKMQPNVRRLELIRILQGRRSETVANFAHHFDVSPQTIRADVVYLQESYPIELEIGPGAHIVWSYPNPTYGKFQNKLSLEQQDWLIGKFDGAGKADKQMICEILTSLGSPKHAEIIEKGAMNDGIIKSAAI